MKTSSPAEMVGYLLTELFLRIPLKPLFQLKLISKRWNSLISDPKLHSSLKEKTVRFILQIPDEASDFGEDSYILSLDRSSPLGPLSITQLCIANQEYEGMGIRIFHSCNGLLVGENGENEDNMDYFVYNPTTGEKKSIPGTRGLGHIHWMYLAFDPSNSPHYKIVSVLSFPWFTGHPQCKFAVYSFKTRSWKKYRFRVCTQLDFEKGVYWNGSVHWISLSKTGNSIYFNPHYPDEENENVFVGDENDSYNVLYDDDNNGNDFIVSVMPTPPILGEESNNYFGESCDHLNFISYYREDEYKFKVYEMKRDYSEWFVRYSVDVSNVWSRVWNKGLGSFGFPRSFDVCGLVQGMKGDDDDSFLVLLIEKRMVVYNVVTGTFEIVSEFDEEKGEEYNEVFDKFSIWLFFKHSGGLHCPLQYIESLCSV